MSIFSRFKLHSVNLPLFLLLVLLITHAVPAFSADDLPTSSSADAALEEELKYLKAETYVITASRILEDIKKTPSSITVITDKQIRQMGARNLADVIQTVPGMNYYYAYQGIHATYARSLTSPFMGRILVMINSHPVNNNLLGGAIALDTLILDNVKRIEVVRGPGSALYGANAFAGVINIITKDAEDIDGVELTARGGNFDTQQYNFLFGKTLRDMEIVFNFNGFTTHGARRHVNEDLQSFVDDLLHTNASLAPGRMKDDDDKYDTSWKVKYKGFTFDGRYIKRHWDMPVGVRPNLNNKSYYATKEYYVNLSYEKTFGENLDFLGKVYRNHDDYHMNTQLYPPGSVQLAPWGPVIMREGMILLPFAKNNRTGFEIQTNYKLNKRNTIVAGISYEEMKQYDVKRHANYIQAFSPIVIIPLPRVMDTSAIDNSNRNVKRNFKAFFMEDIWDITDDLRITAGVRWDDYSDFGSELSPRAGLTWEFAQGYDLKLLYGHAFRAPSFMELYNNLLGNPDLDPEEVDTYQVSLGAEFSTALSGRLTWYRNDENNGINTMIEPGPDFLRNKNFGRMRSEGLELEMRYDFGRGTYLAMNYTYQLYKKRVVWPVPGIQGNIMLNMRLSRHLNLYTACHFEDDFRRDKGDARKDMSGYGIINSTLIFKPLLKGYEGLELRGSVYNLFDKDYTSPTGAGELPEDTPRPGRSFLLEIKYKF